jgi:hypothetical protein
MMKRVGRVGPKRKKEKTSPVLSYNHYATIEIQVRYIKKCSTEEYKGTCFYLIYFFFLSLVC